MRKIIVIITIYFPKFSIYADGDAAAHAAQLPDKITVVVEDGTGTKEIQVEANWGVVSYDPDPGKVNTFTWSFDKADEELAGYVTAGLPEHYNTGTIEVANRQPGVKEITAYNRIVTYAGEPITVDMGSLFSIPEELGSPTYTLTGGDGSLSGNQLTVNAAGEFTFHVVTAATTHYLAQSADAHLMVEKGAGNGAVQVNTQYVKGTAITPVTSSTTNGTGQVMLEYKRQTDPDDYYDTECPTEEGDYTVRATFPATALYHGCQDVKSFSIVTLPVVITPRNRSITYSNESFDLSRLFEFGTGCGEESYTIVAEPADSGRIEGGRLIYSAIGEYRIRVATAVNGSYRAGTQEAVLTVTPIQISAVELTDFTIPKKGNAFGTGLECDTEGVEGTPQVSYTLKNGTDAGMHALSNTEYVMKAVLQAADNYAFADGMTATVDGMTAAVEKNADGTVSVSNHPKGLLDIAAHDRSVVYTGDLVDLDALDLFEIPQELGSAQYSVTVGDGTLSGDHMLAVRAAGEFTIRVVTEETPHHYSQSAEAHLTVYKETGSGKVQVETEYELGIPITPETSSTTNGNDHVTLEYKGQNETDDQYVTTPPTEEGVYTVRATFPETALYQECQDTANFRIVTLEVQIAPNDRSVLFSEEAIDLSSLYEFGTGCGARTYMIVEEPEDGGRIEGDRLTVTKTGRYRIHVTTAVNGKYRAGMQEAVLTVLPLQKPGDEMGTTQQPGGEAGMTEEPVGEAGTTEKLVGETGTTEKPVGETGTTEKPGSEAGTTEEPEGEAGTTEEPEGEAGTTEKPVGETGTTEKPVGETGTTEEPKGETGTTEKPGDEAERAENLAGGSTEKRTEAMTALSTEKGTEQKTTEQQGVTDGTEAATTEEPPKTKQEIRRDHDIALNEDLKASQRGQEIYIRWGQVDEADGYDVYAAYCGTDFDPKKPAKSANSMKVTSVKIRSLEGKKLDRKRNYKLYVTAYKWVKGKKVVIAESIRAHIVGAMNTRYTNVRHIKLEKSKFTLKVGQKAKIRAKAVLVAKNRKQLSSAHAPQFRYVSSYERVATVNEKGRIRAAGTGTCTVYVYARNGYARKVKVTVK